MINANELRIGNRVSGKDPYKNVDGCFKVENIFEDGINLWRVEGFSDEYATNITPIPLTPDILEKSGFRIIAGGKNLVLIEGSFEFEYCDGVNMVIEGQLLPIPHIKYLHQLQNCLYDLTGEELDIKM